MINERRTEVARRTSGNVNALRYKCTAFAMRETIMNGLTLFLVAVGGTGLACYFLTRPAQNRKARRNDAGDGSSSSGGDSSSSDGGLFSWGSSENSSSSDSGSSSDGGGGGGGD